MERQTQLDGLRGLAALVVVFHHWSLVVPGVRDRLADLYLPRLLIAGPQSVVIFFVLSGFVLFIACERHASASYFGWCYWRMVRLCLPAIACVSLSALLASAMAPHSVAALSGWFNNDSWAAPVGALEWLHNIIPLDGRANHQLDNATWSLVVELRISLIFPVIALAVSRSWTVTLLAATVASLFLPPFPGNAFDLLWTARYVFLFAAGAALAMHRAQLKAAFARYCPRPLGAALLVTALAGVAYDSRLLMVPAPLTAAAAVLLVTVCAFDEAVARSLRRPGLVWLGRVSYSLYLVHLPLLLAFVHLLHGRWSILQIAVVAMPVTLATAALLERWVEQPAIRLSRRFLAQRPNHEAARAATAPVPAAN